MRVCLLDEQLTFCYLSVSWSLHCLPNLSSVYLKCYHMSLIYLSDINCIPKCPIMALLVLWWHIQRSPGNERTRACDWEGLGRRYWWWRFVSIWIVHIGAGGALKPWRLNMELTQGILAQHMCIVHPLYSQVVYCYCIWGLFNLDSAKFLAYCIHSKLKKLSFSNVLLPTYPAFRQHSCVYNRAVGPQKYTKNKQNWKASTFTTFATFCDFPYLTFQWQSLRDCPFKRLSCIWVKSAFIVESKSSTFFPN